MKPQPAPPPRVEAIQMEGRIVSITNNAFYVDCWGRWGKDGVYGAEDRRFVDRDPTRQFQFGINTIIFALTQEGSITHRLMTSVR